MKSTLYFIGIAFVFLLGSCKSNKNYTPETFEDQMLTFGNMGGFAGTTNSFTVFENGQLFASQPRTHSLKAIADIKKRDAKQIFENFKNLGFADMELNEPGNLTYFLEYKKGDEVKQLKWGSPNIETPDNLHTFYTNLMMLGQRQAKVGKSEVQ